MLLLLNDELLALSMDVNFFFKSCLLLSAKKPVPTGVLVASPVETGFIYFFAPLAKNYRI